MHHCCNLEAVQELLHRPARSRGRNGLKHRGAQERPQRWKAVPFRCFYHLFNVFNTKCQISVCLLHLAENVRIIISHLQSRTSCLSSLFPVEYCLPESTLSHSLTLSRGEGELFQTSFPLYPLCACSAATCPGYRAQEDCSEMDISTTRGHKLTWRNCSWEQRLFNCVPCSLHTLLHTSSHQLVTNP